MQLFLQATSVKFLAEKSIYQTVTFAALRAKSYCQRTRATKHRVVGGLQRPLPIHCVIHAWVVEKSK
jgi:hypothetical protein